MNDASGTLLDQTLIPVLVKRIETHQKARRFDPMTEELGHLMRILSRTPDDSALDSVGEMLQTVPEGTPSRSALLADHEALLKARIPLKLAQQRRDRIAQEVQDASLRAYSQNSEDAATALTNWLQPYFSPTPTWPFEPLYAGAWEDVSHLEKATRLLDKARAALGKEAFFATILEHRLLGMRTIEPRCYAQMEVAEWLLEPPSAAAERCTVVLLFTAAGATYVDGTSPRFHQYNASTGRLRLDTAAQAEEYLRLFCGAVHGDLGPFAVTDDWGQVLARLRADGSRFDPAEQPPIEPIRMTRLGEEADSKALWRCDATVHYGPALFHARFEIHGNGQVQMVEDNVFWTRPGQLHQPRFSAGIRALPPL